MGKLGKMKQKTDLLVDQIRTTSNQRLMGDKPLAELSRRHMKRVEDALKLLTGAWPRFIARRLSLAIWDLQRA